MKTEFTKGKWRIGERETNGVAGYEIHYSDDGECITDHVYTLADANLIVQAPVMHQFLTELISSLNDKSKLSIWEQSILQGAKEIIKSTE